MRLSDLKIKECAVISSLDIDNIPVKLLEMGCLPGNRIELLRKAPLGDPFHFSVDGCQLCIRKELALKIEVSLADEL